MLGSLRKWAQSQWCHIKTHVKPCQYRVTQDHCSKDVFRLKTASSETWIENLNHLTKCWIFEGLRGGDLHWGNFWFFCSYATCHTGSPICHRAQKMLMFQVSMLGVHLGCKGQEGSDERSEEWADWPCHTCASPSMHSLLHPSWARAKCSFTPLASAAPLLNEIELL